MLKPKRTSCVSKRLYLGYCYLGYWYLGCSCENGKYVASITDDSLITCHETIDAKTKLCDKETKSYNKC